ncbi:O-methyltransferase [Sinorhizobium meliloti]|uniref:O-methyltransferase n=1 Tax=Rhizobium meliloti TaxID=382 RepID=UPI00399A17E6
MPASYREIDYRIRPGKHAERLMMVEAFRHLRFGTVASYQYVGLGSVVSVR